MRKRLLVLFLLLPALFFSAAAQSHPDPAGAQPFVPIVKYLTLGDAESMSAWFADNLEISMLGHATMATRFQARQILSAFFDRNSPVSFDINYVSGRSNMKYALGRLYAGGEYFLVSLFVRRRADGGFLVEQLKIDRERRQTL